MGNEELNALDVFRGSDAEMTKRYYAALEKRGPVGVVAMNLMRAQKASDRAKVYRGGIRGRGSYKSMAYEKKAWSMQTLAAVLTKYGAQLGIAFGWKRDPNVVFDGFPSWVLYVNLPQGQVSFHSRSRYDGTEYAGDWDGSHASAARILEFCDEVYAREAEPRLAFGSTAQNN